MGALIVGLSGALAMLMKRKIEELFCFSLCGIICVLYVFGLFGFLQAGLWVAIGACLAGIAALIWFIIRGRFKEVWARVVTPGALVFGIFLIVMYFGHKDRLFFSHDEFSHWGLALKNFWIANGIPNGMESSTIHFREYPPGITLLQYFWVKLAGSYNEADAFRATNLLILSALLPCMKDLRWKQWPSILFLTVICTLMPIMFNSSAYATVLVDIPMGGLMVYALMTCRTGERDWRSRLIACAALFVLPLIKASGSAVALITLAALALPELVGTHGEVRKRGWRTLVFAAASIFIAIGSWKLYRTVLHVQPGREIDVMGNLLGMLQNGMAWYQQLALISFSNLTADTAYISCAVDLSIVVLIPLYGVIAYYACHKWMPQEEARAGWVFHLTLLLGAVFYIFILLLSYLTAFPPDEADELASFHRYVSTYFFAMFTILIFDILRYRRQTAGSCGFSCAVAMVCVLCCVNPTYLYPSTIMAGYHISDGHAMRAALHQVDTSHMDPAKDKLYYVDMDTTYTEYCEERYLLTPLRVQDSSEPFTLPAPEEWKRILMDEGYTYLYLGNADQAFRQDYGEMFRPMDGKSGVQTIEDEALYRVVESDGMDVFEWVESQADDE